MVGRHRPIRYRTPPGPAIVRRHGIPPANLILVPELLAAGHRVLGLTRSDEGAAAFEAAGAEPHHGTLEDLESLRAGTAAAVGVIHTAFDHDFSRFEANCEKDRRVIEALGAALADSDRMLLITSGTGLGTVGGGQPAREDVFDMAHPNPRIASELAGRAAGWRRSSAWLSSPPASRRRRASAGIRLGRA